MDKAALLERLVRLGATDVPGTPRLLMKHRSPEELASLQHGVTGAFQQFEEPAKRAVHGVIDKIPHAGAQRVLKGGANMMIENPEMIPMQVIPVPGASLAYLGAKKGIEKGLDHFAPVHKVAFTLIEALGGGALVGGGAGAIYGAATGEGTGNRIKRGLIGGAAGAGLGALVSTPALLASGNLASALPASIREEAFWGMPVAGAAAGTALAIRSKNKKKDKEKKAFSTNSFSGPMNPTIETGASQLPGFKQPNLRTPIQKIATSALRKAMHISMQPSGWPGATDMVMRHAGELVGHVTLNGNQVAASSIQPKYQGMGLGKKMYGEAMRRMPGQTLQSDATLTPASHGLWKALEKNKSYSVQKNPALEREGHLMSPSGGPIFKGSLPEKAAIKVAFKLQGHTEYQGLGIGIENKPGSVRKGTTDDGKKWRTVMKNAYGYIKGTHGADGEEVDCYLGPKHDASHAHVVHQHKPDGKGYDEDKVMLGFGSKEEARKAYLAHYDDPKFLGPMRSVPMERFKALLEAGKKLVKISFNLDDAKKVLTAAKPNVIRRSADVVPGMNMGFAAVGGPKRMKSLGNAAAGRLTEYGGATPEVAKSLVNDTFHRAAGPLKGWAPKQTAIMTPQRGDAASFLKGMGMPTPPMNAPQRHMLEGVFKGHEMDEAVVQPKGSFQNFGHLSPDVILREHNRVRTMPAGFEPVQQTMGTLRGIPGGEASALKPYGVEYGQSARLSRHARRRITNMIEHDTMSAQTPALQQALAGMKTAASSPTRGGFLLASDLPAFKQPSLSAPVEKTSDMLPDYVSTNDGVGFKRSKYAKEKCHAKTADISPTSPLGDGGGNPHRAQSGIPPFRGANLRAPLTKVSEFSDVSTYNGGPSSAGRAPVNEAGFRQAGDLAYIPVNSLRAPLIKRGSLGLGTNPMGAASAAKQVGKTPALSGGKGPAIADIAKPKGKGFGGPLPGANKGSIGTFSPGAGT